MSEQESTESNSEHQEQVVGGKDDNDKADKQINEERDIVEKKDDETEKKEAEKKDNDVEKNAEEDLESKRRQRSFVSVVESNRCRWRSSQKSWTSRL